jgi:hypothetical protein
MKVRGGVLGPQNGAIVRKKQKEKKAKEQKSFQEREREKNQAKRNKKTYVKTTIVPSMMDIIPSKATWRFLLPSAKGRRKMNEGA